MDQYITHYGQMRSFNPDMVNTGRLIDELFDPASKTHEIVRRLDEDGNREIIYYQNKESGKIDGPHITTFNNTLVAFVQYKDGLKHGRAYSWYLTGQRQYELMYMNDGRHGYYTHWNIDGDIIEITRYSNGLKDGFNIKYRDDSEEFVEISR